MYIKIIYLILSIIIIGFILENKGYTVNPGVIYKGNADIGIGWYTGLHDETVIVIVSISKKLFECPLVILITVILLIPLFITSIFILFGEIKRRKRYVY